MEKLNNYIDKAFENIKSTKYSDKFKNKLLYDFTERSNELTHAGLKDDNVIFDIIAGEHPDIRKEYSEYVSQLKKKKRSRYNRTISILCVVVYLLLTVVAYLSLSFTTEKWNITWIIPVSMILVLFIYFSACMIKKLSKQKSLFHPISRILLAIDTYAVCTMVFLVLNFLVGYSKSWIVFVINVVVMQLADILYSVLSHQRFALIYILAYLVPISAITYVSLSLLNVTQWKSGWLIIVAGIIIDLFIIIFRLMTSQNNISFDGENEDE